VGHTVTLKLRTSDFTTASRQRSLPEPTAGDTVIRDTANALLKEAWDGAPLRLIGVGVSNIEEREQMDLFAPEPEASVIDRTIDVLRDKFGDSVIRRGAAAATLRDLDWRGEDLRVNDKSG